MDKPDPDNPEPGAARSRLWFSVAAALVLVSMLVLYLLVPGDHSGPVPHVSLDRTTPPGPPVQAHSDEKTTLNTSQQQRVAANTAWVPVDVGAVKPDQVPVYKEVVEGRVLVTLKPDMWTWDVGEKISIEVPQIGEMYESVIERVETGLGVNRSYIGRLIDDDHPYTFVITIGERNAFAHLGTPEGSYELVGNTEFAWLMPTVNMDQHVDYSKPDYFIPGENGDGR